MYIKKGHLPTSAKIHTLLLGIKFTGGIKEMLAMAEINYIKYETNTKGRTYSSAARHVGVEPGRLKSAPKWRISIQMNRWCKRGGL